MGDYIMRIDGQTVKAASINGSDIKEIRNATTQTVLWRKPEPNYFYFEDRSGAANSITCTKNGTDTQWLVLEYSTDKQNWTNFDLTQPLTIPANGKVYLRGNNTSGFAKNNSNYNTFNCTGNYAVGGDLFSILQDGITNYPDRFGSRTFDGSTTLVDISNLNFGNLAISSVTFTWMFQNCSSLTTLPNEIGVTYHSSINPTNANSHFIQAFQTCPIANFPRLPNITMLAKNTLYRCCQGTNANPNTSLKYLDLSNITTLYAGALYQSFSHCQALEVVKIGISAWADFVDSSASDYNATYQWLGDVHSTGVFCKNATLPVMRGANYIPNNWSIADLNGKLYAPVITNTNGTISIAEAEGGASCQIFYTVDSSIPTPENGTLYTQPFTVGSNVTVKAIAHYNGVRADLVTDSDVAWAGATPEPTLTVYSTAKGQGSPTWCNEQPFHQWIIKMKTTGVEGVTYYLNWENTDTLDVYPVDPTTSTYDATATYSGQVGCVEADSECRYTVTICDADMLGDAVNFSVIGTKNGYVSNPSYLSICNGECEEPETDCTDCTNWEECGYGNYEDCQCLQYGIDCPPEPTVDCTDYENMGYESEEECNCMENGVGCPEETDCSDCSNWEECGYESYEDCDCQVNGNCEEEPEEEFTQPTLLGGITETRELIDGDYYTVYDIDMTFSTNGVSGVTYTVEQITGGSSTHNYAGSGNNSTYNFTKRVSQLGVDRRWHFYLTQVKDGQSYNTTHYAVDLNQTIIEIVD